MLTEELELTATWRIGQEGVPGQHLDVPPYKAYYYLKWGEEIIDHKEFSKTELETEIFRLKKDGQDTTDHEEALRVLSTHQAISVFGPADRPG